jgi:hypothetical protein
VRYTISYFIFFSFNFSSTRVRSKHGIPVSAAKLYRQKDIDVGMVVVTQPERERGEFDKS